MRAWSYSFIAFSPFTSHTYFLRFPHCPSPSPLICHSLKFNSLKFNKTTDKTTRFCPHWQFKHSSATQMPFCLLAVSVLYYSEAEQTESPGSSSFPFFFFFFIYFFFIFLFPDSFEHCRFLYHRDQFHCGKPARSDQARLTHETHWFVSGEISHGGG